ncbi:hypothetical protein GHI93_00220 [Lactococcus hircilactis]|uniref:Helicase C-terminal domain-containing protein n=1 Tax=Lactococcus hircilactis TaxID=1494462 RepID=A0A7X1Z6C2_9LACT|nr:SNF2-related protein [Lactococcus hircilactis]MQW38375.1 hypothetical protein [Lactococcus hircilactis]
MNNQETIQAVQQFIAAFGTSSSSEQLLFLNFNRYHHERPIREIMQIYVQNPDTRLLGSFDFWKNKSVESSVKFKEKASVHLFDERGRTKEILFDLAQTTLKKSFEFHEVLLDAPTFVNTLADLTNEDYIIEIPPSTEIMVRVGQYVQNYLAPYQTGLTGYSALQQEVAIEIAKYNLLEEFGVYLDGAVDYTAFENQVLLEIGKLGTEENLLRTFSLANSFSKQLTKLINERYEMVAALTQDLMENQALLNHQIDALSADVDFDRPVSNQEDITESVTSEPLIIEKQQPSNPRLSVFAPSLVSVEKASEHQKKRVAFHRDKARTEAESGIHELEEVQEKLSHSNEKSALISDSVGYHDAALSAYKQLYDSYQQQQTLKLQGHNVSGAYDVYDIETTVGSVQFGYHYIGRERGTDDDSKVVFSISTDNDAFNTVPMSTPIRSRVFDVFEQGLRSLNLEKVEADKLLVKPSVDVIEEHGNILKEEHRSKLVEVEWNETGTNENFEFLNTPHEQVPINLSLLQAMIRDEIKIEQSDALGYFKVSTTLGRLDIGDGFMVNLSHYQALAQDNELPIDVQAYYEELAPKKEQHHSIQEVLQQVRDKMDLPEDFKVKSIGSGDFAIMNESFGGMLNESIVEWFQNASYEIKPNAQKLTDNPFFEAEFNKTLKEVLEAQNILSSNAIAVEETITPEPEETNKKLKLDRIEYLTALRDRLLPENQREWFSIGSLPDYPDLSKNDVVLAIYHQNGTPLPIASLNLEGKMDLFNGIDYVEERTGIVDFENKLKQEAFDLRDDFYTQDGLSAPIERRIIKLNEINAASPNIEITNIGSAPEPFIETADEKSIAQNQSFEFAEKTEQGIAEIEQVYQSESSSTELGKLETRLSDGIFDFIARDSDWFESFGSSFVDVQVSIEEKYQNFTAYRVTDNGSSTPLIKMNLTTGVFTLLGDDFKNEKQTSELLRYIRSELKEAGYLQQMPDKSLPKEAVSDEKNIEEISLFDDFPDDEIISNDKDSISSDTISSVKNTSISTTNDTAIFTTTPTTISSGRDNTNPTDFVFPDIDNFYPRTPSEKVMANLAAIRLSKTLTAENRWAIPEEQEILAKYVGWGGLANDFFEESNPRYSQQREELKFLVSQEEYAGMRKSSLTAYYTSPQIIQTIYHQLENLGFSGGRILDPSMGTGNFFATMPREMKAASELYGVELEQLTGTIASQLQQQTKVQIKGFETTDFADNAMDLVITNVPFSDVIRVSDEKYESAYAIHDYFIKKALDLVHEGGLVAVITSTGTMDKNDSRFREEISKMANLVSAIRLPNDAFKAIAGTDVSSDILIFQKTSTPQSRPEWTKTEQRMDDKGNSVHVNRLFNNQPELVLGKIEIQTRNGGMLTVARDFPQEEMIDKINDAFSQQATAQYFVNDSVAEPFEQAVQENSNVPQEIINKCAPYTIFLYRNKPYYFDGKHVTPHQKTSSVTLNKGENRKNQLARYENNKSTIFEETTSYQKIYTSSGYLDSWSNFIPTEVGGVVTLPKIPHAILEKLNNGENEVVDGDIRYTFLTGKQGQLIIEEAVNTKYQYKLDYAAKDVKAMRLMIEMRHTLQDLLNIQHIPEYAQPEYETIRERLNNQYDAFVKQYGPISNQANSLLMRMDDYYEFLASIEEEVEDDITQETKIIKGAVFFEPTIQPQPKSIQVSTAEDALLASLNHKGQLDFDYMEAVCGLTKEEIIAELGDRLFYVGDGEYQSKEDYLSGDVKTKLAKAKNNQDFYIENKDWLKNIEALEKVLPKDIPLSDITYKYGTRFIPIELYQDFLTEIMESQATVKYDKLSDSYEVKLKHLNRFPVTDTYGHGSFNGQKLATSLLNQRPGKIFMPDPNDPNHKKRILDKDATEELEDKAKALLERFKQWVENSVERQEAIATRFNEQLNRYVVKEYDGSGLTISGLAKQFQPRPHQKNAIMRTVLDLRAGYAHEVGSGKSLTMLASNMKLQELGLVHNALFVIPKPLISQFAREIYKYFPESKVLVAHSEDFKKAGRKRFISRIATGNYNAIIIADSQFGKIAMSKQYQEHYIKRQLIEARKAIEDVDDSESLTVKQTEKAIEGLEIRLEKLRKTDTDTFITFEELGIDMLFVDEAHNFKNLAPFTQLENVKGVSNTRAEKSMDLQMKIEYMHSLYDNRRVVFSTGTPMSNSVVELYTMMNYIEPDVLEKYGAASFDSWVSYFGIIENNFELTAAGTFKVNRRFTKFGNVPELMTMFRETWDIQTAEMLNLPVPHAEMIAHETAITGAQARYIDALVARAKAIESGVVKPWEDNMLKIVGENRKLTLDMRALDDQRYSAFDSEKLTQVVDEVFQIYTDHDEEKSTQMIFSDLSIPVKYRNSQPLNFDNSINLFSAYDEIKRTLIERGIPAQEIRFIHEATNDKVKEALMRDMRTGKVRILIGSTSKAGTGLNVQNKMIAVHHLDVPWRPSDITQRNGRLIRQGNENDNVQIHYYITKGSMDAFLWQTLENKAKVINQIMNGNSDVREMDEIGDAQINMGEYKAMAEGKPLQKEYMELEMKLQGLERSRTRFFDSKITDLRQLKSAKEYLPNFEKRLIAIHEDIETATQNKDHPFSIEIFYQGSTRSFGENDKKTEVADFFARQIQNNSLDSRIAHENKTVKIASYKGFDILHAAGSSDVKTEERLILSGTSQYSIWVNPDAAIGIFTRIDNFIETGIAGDELTTTKEVERLKSSISSIEQNQEAGFSQEKEYQEIKSRVSELRGLLNNGGQTQQREREQLLSR